MVEPQPDPTPMPAPPAERGTVVLTGGSGFVGSALCRGLAAAGWHVRAAQRTPGLGGDRVQHVPYDLTRPMPPSLFVGVSTLIHNGWLMTCRNERQARRVNVDGSRRLFDAARAAGVARIVFVSSCSAHDRALSIYGRTKFEVEGLLDPARDLVVRPGLVIGQGGMALRLQNFVRVLHLMPVLLGRDGELSVQPIGRADLVRGMVRALDDGITGRLVLANPEAVGLSVLALALVGKDAYPTMRLPVFAGWASVGLGLGELLGIRLGFGRDNLLGLTGAVVQPSVDDLARVGLKPRSLAELRRPEMG